MERRQIESSAIGDKSIAIDTSDFDAVKCLKRAYVRAKDDPAAIREPWDHPMVNSTDSAHLKDPTIDKNNRRGVMDCQQCLTCGVKIMPVTKVEITWAPTPRRNEEEQPSCILPDHLL